MRRPSLVSPSGVPIAPATDAAPIASGHYVMMTFPDDHDIGGAKFTIMGVTAEQVAVAIFYMQRAAGRMLDVMEVQAMRAQDEARSVAAAIQAEKGKN